MNKKGQWQIVALLDPKVLIALIIGIVVIVVFVIGIIPTLIFLNSVWKSFLAFLRYLI